MLVSFHSQRFLPLDLFLNSDFFLRSQQEIPCVLTIHDSCGIRCTYDIVISSKPYKITKDCIQKIIKNDYFVMEINPTIRKVLYDEPYEIQVYNDKN
jgi:hypothetical protein